MQWARPKLMRAEYQTAARAAEAIFAAQERVPAAVIWCSIAKTIS
jgi:hypothetical protein